MHEESHGGAWKIALADMMTAMMAFFLVLWLISATDEDVLKGIADHFKPIEHSSKIRNSGNDVLTGGTSFLLPREGTAQALEPSATPQDVAKVDESQIEAETITESDAEDILVKQDEQAFQEIEKKLTDLISRDPTLVPSLNQVKFIREKEGMRIQIVDDENSSMFDIGTDILLPAAARLIEKVSNVLQAVPNQIIIRGHTDSRSFPDGARQNNWSLSAARAEATRRFLEKSGILPRKFAKIEGVSDVEPFVETDMLDPRNRRINIIIKYQTEKRQSGAPAG